MCTTNFQRDIHKHNYLCSYLSACQFGKYNIDHIEKALKECLAQSGPQMLTKGYNHIINKLTDISSFLFMVNLPICLTSFYFLLSITISTQTKNTFYTELTHFEITSFEYIYLHCHN